MTGSNSSYTILELDHAGDATELVSMDRLFSPHQSSNSSFLFDAHVAGAVVIYLLKRRWF